MAFENLSLKLQEVFKNLRGKGKLTEKDVKEAMREVRLALLEADVNFKIVKEFVSNVSTKAIGDELFSSLTPGQHVIKIVNEELVTLLGTTHSKLTFSNKPPTVFMMVGLQGAGKTTTCGKLAGLLRKEGKKPLLVACDIYRPAAVKQLQVVGSTYNIPVFFKENEKPQQIAKAAIEFAKGIHDVIILDTAGRLHIDEELMNELSEIKQNTVPHEILLVVDAMTGQDAVSVADGFNGNLGIDGVIITKLDGDTRGGGALSVRYVTGKPIKYVGMGEKLEDLEVFYPDRMASRILGMGDVMSLIEKAQQSFDENEALALEKKLKNQDFSLEDFLNQMQQIKKMGPLKNLISMMPGIGNKINLEKDVDEKSMLHIEAIIQSMTKPERENPSILNASRKRRISKGSGRSIQEINKLLKQFEEIKKIMKQFSNMGSKKMKLPFMK
ncbi:MAG: signal recognition particle protein [Defluviitaleaceae bacterium]|nr:signal recognition particle protein [Defluviitaleaceae bacterium]